MKNISDNFVIIKPKDKEKATAEEDEFLQPARRKSKRWDKHKEKQDELRVQNIAKARANI